MVVPQSGFQRHLLDFIEFKLDAGCSCFETRLLSAERFDVWYCVYSCWKGLQWRVYLLVCQKKYFWFHVCNQIWATGLRACVPKGIFCNIPSSPISSNNMFSKIDPQRKKIATILVLALSIGYVVARGHHLHVQLCCQNCKFSAPSREILLPSMQQSTMTMKNFC